MSYFKRMCVEIAELDERITKLEAFTRTDKFDAINLTDQRLLIVQLHAMKTYASVLTFRIARAEPDEEIKVGGSDGAFEESGEYPPSLMDVQDRPGREL